MPQQAIDAAEHFGRRPAGEGQQQDPARLDAAGDQPGHPLHQRGGLARAGAGDDQQRPVVMGGGLALLRIQPGQHGLDGRGGGHALHYPRFAAVSQG